ncbi:MAG TPA: hypothetical protein DCZ91_17835 [Lachnospiraceae bacterium]|nr:hypothetical protein [Lachnospiraceae bacterium]
MTNALKWCIMQNEKGKGVFHVNTWEMPLSFILMNAFIQWNEPAMKRTLRQRSSIVRAGRQMFSAVSICQELP